jgi:copper resistance protein B
VRQAFLLSLLGSCALAGAEPALAQEAAEKDKAALSGGFDFIELRAGKGDELFLWDGSFSYGDSTDQIMLMVEGGGTVGSRIDDVQARLLYGRSISDNVVLLAGVRHEFQPHPHDSYAMIGAQGSVGSRFSWEGYVFLSDAGRLTSDAQVIYQLPMTEKIYVEPRAAIGWSAQRDEPNGAGAGFTEAEMSVRLRFRLNDNVNAFVGVAHERLLGDTRALARAEGETLKSTIAVMGFGFSL